MSPGLLRRAFTPRAIQDRLEGVLYYLVIVAKPI